jgi:hypothetical protein
MKRTAAALMLIAGLSGGCMTPDKKSDPNLAGMPPASASAKKYTGPHGAPGMPSAYRGQDPVITRADARDMKSGGIIPVAGAEFPDRVMKNARGGWVPTGTDGIPGYFPGRGILPVPAMGPYGAVAAIGALPPYGLSAPINARTSVRFSEPQDMRITWYTPTGVSDTVLTAPARYNFAQGGIYRLKISNFGRGATELYPTLEVAPATPKTASYLAHSSVPVSFTDEDFEQVLAGNYLVKVIYLPDPQYQDIAAVAGPAEVISTKLEPGMDPEAEARRRGEILLIIRMGNIDLDAKGTPPIDAPNPFAMPPVRPLPPPIPSGPHAFGPGAEPMPLVGPAPAEGSIPKPMPNKRP